MTWICMFEFKINCTWVKQYRDECNALMALIYKNIECITSEIIWTSNITDLLSNYSTMHLAIVFNLHVIFTMAFISLF